MSIVRLEQVFYADGKVLMVLEYLPGGDLFDGLVSRPFYSEKDACACARQIIMALNYLSRKGIIHRVRKTDTSIAPKFLLYVFLDNAEHRLGCDLVPCGFAARVIRIARSTILRKYNDCSQSKIRVVAYITKRCLNVMNIISRGGETPTPE